jgi:hypothetical protein
MIYQEDLEESHTAHEMAIELKDTIQDTLTELGIDYKHKDNRANDFIQMTADDFDNLDHYNLAKGH